MVCCSFSHNAIKKGNLALGAYTHPDGIESESAQRDLRVGKGKSKSYVIGFSFRNHLIFELNNESWLYENNDA
jgi:hypothetical protein